jgi:hypothetical protein
MKIMSFVGGCCGGAEAGIPVLGELGACCGMTRQFLTKEERRKALEEYRDELKKELAGLEEHIKDMGK